MSKEVKFKIPKKETIQFIVVLIVFILIIVFSWKEVQTMLSAVF